MAQKGRKLSRSMAGRLAIATLVVVALLVPPGHAVPRPTAAKIEAALQARPRSERVDFWVTFENTPDLARAARSETWAARGRQVVDELKAEARGRQQRVLQQIKSQGAKFEAHWISNAIKVTGNRALMERLAAYPEVQEVVADQKFELPPIQPAATATSAGAPWNISAVRAPEVWSTGATGQGIVVANIDTGVDFTHPALVNQYRGNQNGTIAHGYSWFDPSGGCSGPCDANGHGTHTMGTAVGAAGTGSGQIGVAPGARWIAARGCIDGSCSLSDLLAAGEWMLAPTDANGQNPRPDLRPHVINNSWASSGGNAFFQDMVNAWEAAGIFSVFASGNSGPGCGTTASPGDYANSYSVGAYDSAGAISGFSGRGGSVTGLVKPDIAAPGSAVRSSVPGGGYGTWSGTSMATPHVTGVVALLWSAVPAIQNDVALTRQALDQSAFDVGDLSCGGSLAKNNVWGEGVLDALGALQTVAQINDAPDAVNDVVTTPEDAAVDIAVLANDSDANGDQLTVSISSGPAHGSASVISGGRIRYLPAPDFHGADSLHYVVDDRKGGSDSAQVQITVIPVNDEPRAVADSAQTDSGRAAIIDVLANDSDPDSDPLSVASVADPEHGQALVSQGKVTYTPDAGFSGTDSFSYTVADPAGATATALVSVGVALPKTLQAAVSSWGFPGVQQVSGVGGWVIPQNVPVAGSGQVKPHYTYANTFWFSDLASTATMALEIDGTQKHATLSVARPDKAPQQFRTAYDWKAGRSYFMYAFHLGGGKWGAWLIDTTDYSWITLGTFRMAASQTTAYPASATYLAWLGEPAPTCDSYPKASARILPVGFKADASGILGAGHAPVNMAGDCPAQNAGEQYFTHYQLGR